MNLQKMKKSELIERCKEGESILKQCRKEILKLRDEKEDAKYFGVYELLGAVYDHPWVSYLIMDMYEDAKYLAARKEELEEQK